MYKLRPYQIDAIAASLKHFSRDQSPDALAFTRGVGKNLVIPGFACLEKRRVFVMAHVRELVEQNYAKFLSFGREAGIYSAGLKPKEMDHKVVTQFQKKKLPFALTRTNIFH